MPVIKQDTPNKAEIFSKTIRLISDNASFEEARLGLEAFLDSLESHAKNINPIDTDGSTGRLIAIAVLIDRMKEETEVKTAIACFNNRLAALESGEVSSVASPAAPVEEPSSPDSDSEARNRVFKECVTAIASVCDGAASWDGKGFNGADTSFGKWTAKQFNNGRQISRRQAQAVHKMMVKYKKQLSANNLELPAWNEIESCYPDGAAIVKPEKRLEMIENGSQVAVYTSRDENHHFKAIGYIRFDWDGKFWRFEATKVVELVEKAEEIGGYHIDLPCQTAFDREMERRRLEQEEKERRAIEAASEITELVKLADLESPIACGWQLFEHQRKGAEWLLAHGKAGIYRGGILADQMGLGKTIEALTAAKAVKASYDCHIMIICPSSLKDNWLIEAAKVGVKVDVFSWAKMPLPLERTKYLVIADEAHYAQNPDAQRTKNLWKLARHENCLYSWMLTGTPIKNGRPINLFPLLYAVDHPLSRDRKKYEKTYCQAGYRQVNSKGKTIYDNQGAGCLDDLAKMTQDVILQRKKHDCLDLPEKLRSYRPVELDSLTNRVYEKEIQDAVADYRRRAELGEVDKDAEVLVTLQLLRKIGSKYKAETAIEAANELLEQGEQVVIFTEFLESAEAIATALSEYVQVEKLTGDVDSDKRQAMVERFQAGESRVFVGTIKAGGVGLTLTAASYVLMVDRPWTPGDAQQAEDRCHRIGQKNTVIPVWLQLSTIDVMVDNLLEQKQRRIDLVMAGKRKTLRGVGSIHDLAKELIAAI